jgi:hypothetical protein
MTMIQLYEGTVSLGPSLLTPTVGTKQLPVVSWQAQRDSTKDLASTVSTKQDT